MEVMELGPLLGVGQHKCIKVGMSRGSWGRGVG